MYFDVADTILDPEVRTRLGMESRFDEPSVGAPRVKRTGECGHGGFGNIAAVNGVRWRMSGQVHQNRAFLDSASLEAKSVHLRPLFPATSLDPLAGGATNSVVPVNMVTDPTQNNIFNRPVVQVVPPQPGVSILAQ